MCRVVHTHTLDHLFPVLSLECLLKNPGPPMMLNIECIPHILPTGVGRRNPTPVISAELGGRSKEGGSTRETALGPQVPSHGSFICA